jgi:hypothetical protein
MGKVYKKSNLQPKYRVLLFSANFAKGVCDVLYVSINKHLIHFKNYFCVLSQLCQGNGYNLFSCLQCLQATCCLQATG